MNSASYSAYIFDYDDTLVRTRESKFAAIRETARRHYGKNLSDADIEKYWGIPFREFFRSVFQDITDNTEEVISHYLSVTKEFPMVPFAKSVETLNLLAEDYFVGLLTSASKDVVIPDLKRLGFAVDTFAVVQCAEDTECHKPDPAVFDPILARLTTAGIAASETLYVGDAITDYHAAHGAGLHFLGLVQQEAVNHPFEQERINFVRCLSELLRESPRGDTHILLAGKK